MLDLIFVLLIVAAYVVVFVIFWSGVVYLISRTSGWARLSEEYPAIGRVQGSAHNWSSARFRMLSSYSYCLSIIIAPTGIYMEPMIFLRIGHSPIFIPREAIQNLEHGKSLIFRSVKLTVEGRDNYRPTTITLHGKSLATALGDWSEI
jgi:hypothetical protein